MNLQKITEEFVSSHPYIRVALKKGIINYSSLTRMIAKENDLDLKTHFDAILIACRRYKEKLSKDTNEKDILALLKKSKITVKNKVAAIVFDGAVKHSFLSSIEKDIKKAKEDYRKVESNSVTIITSEDIVDDIKARYSKSILKIHKNLVEVTLTTSKEIEQIPGVMAFIFSLLAENDVNVVEAMSCWIDSIVIIEEKDLAKVMGLLRF